jgi:hypothetical protein
LRTAKQQQRRRHGTANGDRQPTRLPATSLRIDTSLYHGYAAIKQRILRHSKAFERPREPIERD